MASPITPRTTPTRSKAATLPGFVPPQLTQLVKEVPVGDEWLHEIKFDGYRMAARLDRGEVRLLTRTGLNWTDKYPPIAEALAELPVGSAYLDGELCGVRADGTTSFSMIQAASDAGNGAPLVFFVFDCLHLNGEDLTQNPLRERKRRLAELLTGIGMPLQYSDHQFGHGPEFHGEACRLRLEGIVSKRAEAAYAPGNRGIWVKTKCLNREEFVVVGWTDPEGSRPDLGSLLLAYYAPDGRLVYAGRAGTGINTAELRRLRRRLQLMGIEHMPLDVPPPRTSRFGSPLMLSRVHWVRPELVAEVTFLTWTEEGLLRHVVYQGLREDKPAREVTRPLATDSPPPATTGPTAVPRGAAAPRVLASRRGRSTAVPAENILQLLPEAVVPSKEALAAYWTKVATRALKHLGRRPLKLVRHTKSTTFYHMGPLPPVPSAVHQLRIEKRSGGQGIRLWVDDLAGLLGLVEIGAVELHPWGATVDDIEHPDMLVFDLDPGEGILWEFVTESAFALRKILAAHDLDCWPKTTGGKGLHIMAPIAREMTWDAAHEFARRIAAELAADDRNRYVTSADLAKRPGKLFIDYLRNGRGTTAVGAYSPRAREGFPVAAPVTWRDIEKGLRSDAFTTAKPPKRG
jgi:bifunctional non-homologous end joining protein LigD